MPKLQRECPVCGSDEIKVVPRDGFFSDGYAVECQTCNNEGEKRPTKLAAIEAWNAATVKTEEPKK